MSNTGFLRRLAALLLGLMLVPIVAPTVAPAQEQLWIDIAAALWRDGSGTAHVAAGYSGQHTTGQAATAAALQACQNVGGRGCQNFGPVRGCGYITVGKTRNGVAYGVGATPDDAVAAIKNNGATSWQRTIGGCGQ